MGGSHGSLLQPRECLSPGHRAALSFPQCWKVGCALTQPYSQPGSCKGGKLESWRSIVKANPRVVVTEAFSMGVVTNYVVLLSLFHPFSSMPQNPYQQRTWICHHCSFHHGYGPLITRSLTFNRRATTAQACVRAPLTMAKMCIQQPPRLWDGPELHRTCALPAEGLGTHTP